MKKSKTFKAACPVCGQMLTVFHGDRGARSGETGKLATHGGGGLGLGSCPGGGTEIDVPAETSR